MEHQAQIEKPATRTALTFGWNVNFGGAREVEKVFCGKAYTTTYRNETTISAMMISSNTKLERSLIVGDRRLTIDVFHQAESNGIIMLNTMFDSEICQELRSSQHELVFVSRLGQSD